MVGCAENGATPSRIAGDHGDVGSPPAATLLGKDDGLEVRWWTTEASGDALLSALGAELANPVPLDDRTREILAANGIRVVRIAVEAADHLPSQLRPLGSVQQQRLAQTGVWTDVARGPTWERSRLLTMHDGPLELPAGRLRLLARGWVTPMPAVEGDAHAAGAIEPTVSFELVPQHQDRIDAAEREVSDLTLEEPDATVLGQGVMFWRLALRGQLRHGEALVVLAEDPFQRWSEGEESAPPASSAEDDAAPSETIPIGRVKRGHEERTILAPAREAGAERRESSNVGPVAGPPSLAASTIGEALLTSRPASVGRGAGASGKPGARSIVVLVPRTPENFRLLGGSGGR